MNLLELFKQSLLLQKKPASPITVKNYLSDVRHFILWLEEQIKIDFDPKLITEETLELYKNAHITIFSSSSLERHLSSLRKFFVFLTEKNITDRNPFTKSVTTKTTDLWKIKEFKDLLYRQNASAHTIKNYIKDIEGIRNWHAQTLGVDITDVPNTIGFQLIQEYKTRLLYVAKLSPKTINRKLSAIRRYIEFTQNIIDSQSIAIQNVSAKPAILEKKQAVAKSNQIAPTKKQNFFNFLNPSLLEDVIAHKIAQGIKSLQGKNDSKTNILSNIKKEFYAPDSLSIKSFPLHRKLYHHIRYTRPEWYKKYHNQSFAHYFNASLLIIYSAIIGLMLYQNLFEDKRPSFAAPNQPLKVYSFQGRLTDSSDEPITTSKLVRFILYTSATASSSARLWEEVRPISPDSDGIFSVLLGSNSSGGNATTCNGSGAPSTPATGACGIHDNLFRDHSEVFLGISIERDSELTPRQQIATVAYSTNAHFLQGLPPITQSNAGTTNVVLALDSSGNLTVGGSASPTFQATGGQFTLSGNTLKLISNTGSAGNIQLSPDGMGKIDLQKPIVNTGIVGNLSPGGVEINDKFGILATESAVAAFVVNNNTTGGDIFTASSSGTTQFTIANDGTTTITGSVLPKTTSSVNLGSTTLKWNNIYVNTINTTSTNTSGQAIFSYNPASTAFSESSVFINPTTADANDTLLGIGIGGTQKAGIDYEGDLVLGYSSSTAPLVSNPFNVYNHGTSLVATIDTSGNASFSGTLKLSTSPTIQSTANQTLTLGGNTTGDISFAPGGSSNALYLKTGGNVGVGTTSPGGLGAGGSPTILHVNDSGSTTNDFALLNLSTADVANGGTVGSLEFGTTGTASSEKRSAMILSALSAASGTNVSGNLSFYTNNAGSITEKLQITAAGQIQAPVTGSTGGLLIGGDTQLYRGNMNELYLAAGDNFRVVSGALTFDSGLIDITYTNGLAALKTKITGDSNSRFYIESGGALYWGNGTAGVDVDLYRSAADVLKTDDSFVAAVKGTIGQSTIQTNAIFKVAGTTNTVGSGGSSLAIFDSTVTATANGDNINSIYTLTTVAKGGFTGLNSYGIFIDANAQSGLGTILNAIGLHVAAQTIGTNNYGVKIDATSTQTLWISGNADNTTAAAGIAFGSSRDTNLYRSAASTLKTDGAFIAGRTTVNASIVSSTTTALCWTSPVATGTIEDCNGVPTDLAENFGTSDSSIEAGDLVATDLAKPAESIVRNKTKTSKAYVVKTSKIYQSNVIGIISTAPNQLYGDDGLFDPEENPKPVTLAGRVPVKVSTENGPIKTGDAITSSSIPGVGMRATKTGPIIGRALSSYNETGIGKVIVFVNTSWHDPNVYITNTGDLSIQLLASEIKPKYQVSDSLNQAITHMGAFAELVTGNIRAGIIDAQQVTTNSLQLTTNNITIAGQSIQEFILATVREAGFLPMSEGIVSPLASIDQIHTNIISPLGSETIAVTGNIEVKNAQNKTVARIDTTGNATLSGQLISKELQTTTATISGMLAAEAIQTNSVQTSTLTTADATISGTLRAGRILADDIEGLNARIATLAANTITNYGTASAELISSIPQAQLDLGFIDISTFSASFGTFREGLVALGPSTFGQITAVDSISVGTNLAITTNSINLLGEDLQIQPLRQGGISFLAGLVRIDTNGNLTVGGNADFAKNVTVRGTLAANIISPLPDKDLVFNLPNSDIGNSKLEIRNSSSSAVLAIDSTGDLVSSGSGTFNKLKLSFAQPAYALDNTTSVATGSAGTAILKSTKKEITINNPLVTENSLIYVTPVGTATNQVLYLLRQVAKTNVTTGSFTVGVAAPTLQDLQFNWIIVN